MQRLRFALLFNGRHLERWQLHCVEQLETTAQLVGILFADDPAAARPAATGSLVTRLLVKPGRARETVDVGQRFANVARIAANHGTEPVELDFVLRLGRVPIAPGIAVAARHGVWCFEHEVADEVLPFYREVYDGQDVTHAALLSFGAAGGAGVVLEQGWFRTEKRSYELQLENVLASAARWPGRVCQRLAARAGGHRVPSLERAAPAQDGLDHRARPLRFGARIALRRLRFAWERLFRHPQWNIGLLPTSAAALLQPGAYRDDRIEWFPLEGRERFLADPFGIVREGKLHLLCEEFGYRSGKGHISTVAYHSGGFARRTEPAIALPAHMSYPCLVEDGGETYCVPETCQAGEVALYRAVEFPRRWTRVATLIEGFAGVDPTVFRHGGRWWLTCTERGREEDASLWIWHAPALHGPWTAHAGNPVKTDVRGARPGGAPFVHDGVLYRPTQDCSRRYGWRIVIQRVSSLTPSEFAEEPAAVLEASPDSPYPLGRHTLTPLGDVVLIDGHRAVFAWLAFRSFLRIWARDLTERLRPRRVAS
jgi:hypothetical protein